FGVSKLVFPFIQAALLGGWVAGSLTLKKAMGKWGIPKVKRAGITLSIVGGGILTLMTALAPRDPYLLTSGMVFFAFGANWIVGLYFPEGMELLPKIKGVTASLLTSIRLFLGAAFVQVGSYFYDGTIYPLTAIV